MSRKNNFRNEFAESIFYNKYAQGNNDTWWNLANRLVDDVCGTFNGRSDPLMSQGDRDEIVELIYQRKFIPGGRYLYYAGRDAHYWNNCYLLKAEEDTREEWGRIARVSSDCLMSGGGIGTDYSILREGGVTLSRTGGLSSGPLPLMCSVNEIGRNVMQGGSRRSAIYASLNWQHGDIRDFLRIKNWKDHPVGDSGLNLWDVKQTDFNFPAPLDHTNISVNYDDAWRDMMSPHTDEIFMENCKQAMMTGEPGFSFNFGDKQNETLRNAPLGPETYVFTLDGYRQIKDIVGETVKVWTGKQWAKTVFKRTGEHVPVLRVLMSGGREIVADPEHEFFLSSDEKVSAKDLVTGDSLKISLCEEIDSFLTEDYYTLGYIYGDGSFSKKYPRAEVTFCTQESKQCLNNFDKSMLSSVTANDSRGYTRVYTINDKLLSNRSKVLFPDDLYLSGTAQQVSFLAGLFDADGNYFKEQNRVRLSNKNYDFLCGVRRLLEQVGILSGISTSGISSYGNLQGYTLTVYTEFVNRFSEIIPTARLKIRHCIPYRKAAVKVISVQDYGFSDVFCCDVGVEEHAFMAEGVIVSNCTEVTSEDDSDVCNLASVNLSAIDDLEEFETVVNLASKFLICGTLRADLPYQKVYDVRAKNRRLGLGLMGIHEWLLKRGSDYTVTPELKKWLEVYESGSERGANDLADWVGCSRPIAYRAIAPTGSISILAQTTSGIEPVIYKAYKRRYLVDGTKWKYQFVVDATARYLVEELGIKPDEIETSVTLSEDFEKRIKFQAEVQEYVDMAISSTINLAEWGSKSNNEGRVKEFAAILGKYAPKIRGFTAYPDGSRGGQPITEIPYEEAVKHQGVEYAEHEICSIAGKGGACSS